MDQDDSPKTFLIRNHNWPASDVGQHESRPYLVSELLEGKTLREELGSGRLSQRQALAYALQLAHGLAAAHAKGIVHRDEMLSGQRAFRRQTQIETMNAILRDDPPELTKTNPNLSPAIERVVRRCLEKQADRRFQSASDLAFAVEGAGAAPTTVEPSTPERRMKKALLVAVALAVVVLGGMGIWLYYFSGRLAKLETTPPTNTVPPVVRAVESKSVAVLPFVNMSADKDNEYLSDGITEELCTALTQVRGLRVPARTSWFVFKGKTDDIRKIGQQLNVATVLEGRVAWGQDHASD